MRGNKMETTVEALKLFIQSLPAGSKFQIISFGSSHTYLMNDQYVSTFDYTNENIKWVKSKVKMFMADFGGTNIYNPLKDAFSNVDQ
jgi:hypothetical protein